MKRRTRKDLTIALTLALAIALLLLMAGGAEAATLKVTGSNWEPQGRGAYDITPYKTAK
jgi:hypothetical protein